ncbi:MAG: hypothetical protein M1587_01825 [Thaumarchaeota archaeon]|nr:hypothetical protein [Nitrososphaerota archaeon]
MAADFLIRIFLRDDSKSKALNAREIASLQSSLEPPNARFWDIKPSKYVVKISNATAPFVLSYSEAYSQQWKLYVSKSPLNLNMPEVQYANPHVTELVSSGTFSSLAISSLKKYPLTEVPHSTWCGYANSWYVDPSLFDASNLSFVIVFEPELICHTNILASSFNGLMLGASHFATSVAPDKNLRKLKRSRASYRKGYVLLR